MKMNIQLELKNNNQDHPRLGQYYKPVNIIKSTPDYRVSHIELFPQNVRGLMSVRFRPPPT